MLRLKRLMKNPVFSSVVTAALTVLATSVATAYPEVYATVCHGGVQWTP